MAGLLAKDYVLQAIDTGKQRNAEAVVARVRTGKGRGIPWMVVLDPEGKVLVTSDGPKGNIGCPYEPHEIAYFRTMLEQTRKRLGDADLDAIVKANEAFVERLKQAQKK